MQLSIRRVIGAVVLACAFFTVTAVAGDVAGPTYPLPNNTGLVSGGGNTGAISRPGGATWSFASATPTAQQLLWWGPATNGVELSFGNPNPGDVLTFNAGTSNLAAGLAIYNGHTTYRDGSGANTRFTMTYKVGGNPVALVLASTLNRPATVGAMLPLTTPSSGFTVNMLFEADDGGGFQPALVVYDNHMINFHEDGTGGATSSISGGYYTATPPKITGITPTSLVVQPTSTSGAVSFQVTDAESPPANLIVTATSDTQSVIADGNITLSGTNPNRSFKVLSTAQTGLANITLSVTDGLQSATAVVPVRVNAPPHLDNNSPLGVVQGGSSLITSAQLSGTDPDTASPVTYVVIQPTSGGALVVNGVANPASFTQADVNAGLVSYTQNGSCNTFDNFVFEVKDVDGAIAHDGSFTDFNFVINITQTQSAPIAQSASYQVALGGTLTQTLTSTTTDCSNPARTYQLSTPPSHGMLSIDANSGSFTYTADSGYSGPDSFTFNAITYGNMMSGPATISLDIEEQAPVAQNASINPNENVAFNGTLVATDANLPVQPLTYILGTLPTKGTVVLNDATTGSYTYTPNTDAIGADSFTFTASNGSLTSNEATISISIRGKLHSGEMVVADEGDGTHPASLVLFDPVSGQQALISTDPLLSSGGGSPIEVAVGADGKILVSVNSKVVQVDPTNGSASVFATGFGFTLGVAVESDGNVLVADPAQGHIVRLDGTTGATIGAPMSLGAGTAPGGIAVASDGSLYVSDVAAAFGVGPTNSVDHLNADGSGLTTLTSGDQLTAPLGITLNDGDLFISNAFAASVIQIDTTTGAQTVLTSGGNILNSSGIASDGTQLYVISQNTAAVIGVDPATGTQTPLTSGGYLHKPFSIAAVSLRATTTAITSELPDPSVPGNAYVVSVSVNAAEGSGTPTGTVNVDDGAGATCVATLANGSGSCSLTSAVPGPVTITASYVGDAVFAASTTTNGHLVGPYPTTTTVTSTAASVVGQSYAVTVTVTAPSGTPDGTVSVTDDATPANTCGPATLSNGTATCNIAWTAAGTYSLTATYTPGTATQFASSVSLATSHTVNKGDTTVQVTPATGSVTVLSPYQVNVAVSASSPASGTPTGSVDVGDGTDSCSIPVLDGAASGSCMLTPTSVGNKVLKATYSGDSNFNSFSGQASLTVTQASSSTTLGSSINPSTFGQSVTFTATVSGLTPTGSVTFNDGATAVAGCSSVAFTGGTASSPTAVCTTTALTAAIHSITAVYSGDASNVGSTSTAVSQVVTRATATTTLSTSCQLVFVQNEPFTMTATVSGTSPTGGVTFNNGATALCNNVSLTAGSAACTTSALTVVSPATEATYNLTANYLGDANYTASTSTALTVTVLSSSDVIFRNGFEAETASCPIE